uniref:Uncharacterized protein n=1 Tax=Arundo donax TaxID=35708 RepID=A0A0A8YMR6_ARUDO
MVCMWVACLNVWSRSQKPLEASTMMMIETKIDWLPLFFTETYLWIERKEH